MGRSIILAILIGPEEDWAKVDKDVKYLLSNLEHFLYRTFLILGSFEISEHPGDKILSPKIYTLPIGVIVACCLGVGPLQK